MAHRRNARAASSVVSVLGISGGDRLAVDRLWDGISRLRARGRQPVVSTFKVPTYAWDKGSGMDALVSGTLAGSPPTGTLLSNGEGPDRVTQAVFFPNATGVTYENGVQAVVDADGVRCRRSGVLLWRGLPEGVSAESDLGKQWLAQCPGTEVREGAVINDEPSSPPLNGLATAARTAGPDRAEHRRRAGRFRCRPTSGSQTPAALTSSEER